jgi:hypothetical protein
VEIEDDRLVFCEDCSKLVVAEPMGVSGGGD